MRPIPTISSPASLVSLLLALGAAACGAAPPPEPSGPAAPAPSAMQTSKPVETVTLADVGLDAAAMDRTADACTDFYQLACGGWLKSTEIPGDEAAWARSFSEIDKKNEAELRRILETATSAKTDDPVGRKIGAYYAACMDETAVEAAKTKAIEPLLAQAKKVKDPASLGALLAALHAQRIWAVFDVASMQDFKDATKQIAGLDQNGLGLPDRDYYTREDDTSKNLREQYSLHVERMFVLAGLPATAAKRAALDVVSLETSLAKLSKTKVERRDPQKMYNKVDRAGLVKAAPDFPWDAYFEGLGFPGIQDISVTSVSFFEGVGTLVKSTRPEVWRSYLTWHIVRSTAKMLPKAFVDEAFSLEAALTGQKEQRPRWKRCVGATDAALGELLAQPFIASSFPGESKARAEAMVFQIRDAFARELAQLDWMDETTKKRASAKLESMAYLIGYPNKWRSYDFEVDGKKYAQNALAARRFETKRDLGKVGKPVDREEWQMSPPTVNAYYDPQKNHMVFPAGILQPPFYSVKSAVAVNLGGIGMVIGHELTHGFDDEGSQFDGSGNLANWWEPAVGKLFESKTSCVADQYAAYEPLPGLKVDGRLTLGENIADLGGLKLAFHAYRQMQKGAEKATVADGFTEDQQFFLAHGQAWCSKYREEAERMLVQTNPHSPPRYRVNGPLANLPEFAQAFACKPGASLRPAKGCEVW